MRDEDVKKLLDEYAELAKRERDPFEEGRLRELRKMLKWEGVTDLPTHHASGSFPLYRRPRRPTRERVERPRLCDAEQGLLRYVK